MAAPRGGLACTCPESAQEQRAYAHAYSLQYFKLADARLTSITPVLASLVPAGVLASLFASWTAQKEVAVLAGCGLASLLFFFCVWLVLAYSHAYEHLVAKAREYEEKTQEQTQFEVFPDWTEKEKEFTRTGVDRYVNFGILAPTIYRPLVWLYFVGIFGSGAAAAEWLIAKERPWAIWAPLAVAIALLAAACWTNVRYLGLARDAWHWADAESGAHPEAAPTQRVCHWRTLLGFLIVGVAAARRCCRR